MEALLQGCQPSIFHLIRHFSLSNMGQHGDGCVDKAGWVGHIFSGNVGCRSMYGFEHGNFGTNVGGTAHTHRTTYFGGDIGNNVAIKVGRDHNIIILWTCGQTGRTYIDNLCFIFDFGVFQCDFIKNLMEQSVRQFHDIVLHHTGDLFSSERFGIFKSISNNTLATRPSDKF